MRNSILTAAVAVTALMVPGNLAAWGDYGHRTIGLAAAQSLPTDMPAFFRNAADQLGYLNPEPDRWKDRSERALDSALYEGTSPDHYIDMDLVPLPVLRSALAAADRFGYADTLRNAGISAATMGTLPFEILELSQRLRRNFRLWRIAPDSTVRTWIEQRIINDAGLLGHYIADGSNPAHTSKHHNGWVGDNPKGYATDTRFHTRFESQYVQGQIRMADVTPLIAPRAVVIENFRPAIVAYLNESFAQLETLYDIDKRAPFREETTTPEQKAFTAKRLAAGATMLRDIWYSAWVLSGRAVPPPVRR